jgi:signal transduction histidine kinase
MTAAGLRDRIVDLALRVRVSVKVMGIALGLTLLLGGTLLWQVRGAWHRLLLDELDDRGRVLGSDLATHGIEHVLGGNVVQMRRMLQDVRSRVPEVEYVIVLDARGGVLASTLPATPSPELLAANELGPRGASHVVPLDTEDGPVRDVAVPILDGRAGTIRIGMSERLVATEVGWLVRRLAIATAIVGVLGVIAALVLTAILTKPIREMAGLARAVEKEDFEARAVVRAKDELGKLAVAFNEMAAALRGKETARQELLRQLLAAGEDERKRVARELHDGAGQALTSLIAGLGALEADGGDHGLRGRLADLRSLASQTLGEIHDLSMALRPAALDDLGLMAALGKHCETFARRFDLAVDCESVGLERRPRLPSGIELASYRIVQEALTNAARHGRARNVSVLVQRRESDVLLVIEDDGVGFRADGWRARSTGAGHLGLLGIEERAALLGGKVRVESAPGSGTSLFVELPLGAEGGDV